MQVALLEEAARLWCFVANTAPIVAYRPALYKSKAHSFDRNISVKLRPGTWHLFDTQLAHPFADTVDITPEEATALYEQYEKATYELMLKKNHDYGEAWRDMRVSSYTDFILTKIERVKEIENIKGATLASEGIDANYMDIIIYAVFGAIKLSNE